VQRTCKVSAPDRGAVICVLHWDGTVGLSSSAEIAFGTVRMIGEQYSFVPQCVQVPVDTPVKFRITSTDVIHGFLLPATNVNTMVVPGFVAEVRTAFSRPGIYEMPCNEFCGYGHHGMLARVKVVPKEQFPSLSPVERTSCAKQ
jgi:cytochrome c oxidase subunit 2